MLLAGGKFSQFNVCAQPASSFTRTFVQEDYRGDAIVKTHNVTVSWDSSTGVLTINNFYSNPIVNDAVVNLVLPSYATETSSPTTLTWESNTKGAFTWRVYSMGESDVFANLPFSYSGFKNYKAAVVSRFQRATTPVRIYDPEANTVNATSNYSYYGAADCNGTIDLDQGIIEIVNPWGCAVGNNTWSSMSATIVIEYFEHSILRSVSTGINDVNAEAQVVNTRYYNTLGVEADKPFNGVNIVVKEYSNGQKTTSKQIMR